MQFLLPGAAFLTLESIAHDGDRVSVAARSHHSVVACPSCQATTSKIHSRYRRTFDDLPMAGISVRIQLQVRKFFCTNKECSQRIFCERLPEVVDRNGFRSSRFNQALAEIGFSLGGRAGSRLAIRLGIQTQKDSILRRMRLIAAKPSATPQVRVLGVDDWALKKGQHYATILVDLEKQRPVDLLLGREAAPLEQWLKNHSEIEVIARDRAGAYAEGARKGAPQAEQVADRWHVLKNANEAFERLIQRQQKTIVEAVARIPANEPVSTSQEVIPKVVEETPTEYMRSRAAKERRQTFHAHRKTEYEKVQELKGQGFTIIQIKKHLGWGYSKVAGFFAAAEYPSIRRRSGRSCLDPFSSYLAQRWESGCRNARDLYREICAKGYRGSEVTVRRHVQQWRKQDVKTLPPAPKKLVVPAPRSSVWLLLKTESVMTDTERQLREAIENASPEIKQGLDLVQSFRNAIKTRDEISLSAWIDRTSNCGLPEFENFVTVLRRDEKAVRAAASSPWSNGQTEGQVNRLKVLKRQMYGRANFDLLRARVLNPG